ncbi:hypothetical protein [uncultured Nostoc sp.]|uniref:hypothetical protein n=1 Tax=uncultured Nostoc sp. TaxID=340711 RepID=UPI0035CB177D
MPPADDGYQDSDYGSDLLTNPDSDTFKSIASQAATEKTDKTVVASQNRSIATRREKVLPTPRVTKVNRNSHDSKSTKPICLPS